MFKLHVKLCGGKLPENTKIEDAGFDLFASESISIPSQGRVLVKLGFCTSFNSTFVGLIRDRSGHARKHGLIVGGGVIDSGYRGEWGVILHNLSGNDYTVEHYERIAQVLFLPCIHMSILQVDTLSDSLRGVSGYGASGK